MKVSNLIGFVAPALVALAALPRVSAQSASDFYVHNLPGLDKSTDFPTMHSGHITIKPDTSGTIFFWHVANEFVIDKQKTVIWFNGGPGCSSLDGALMEIGPFRVQDDLTLKENEGSWHKYANLLFIDQPVGVGFSTSDGDSYVHNLDEMAVDVITFLDKFFAIFPEYLNTEIYLAGESYAGQYIPYVARAILEQNKLADSDKASPLINLKGLIIGNGWIDPVRQYLSYLPFAYQSGLIKSGTPLADKMEASHKHCAEVLSSKETQTVHEQACEAISQSLLGDWNNGKDCFNIYDVRLTDSYPACGMNWPPDLTSIYPYLALEDVRKALHTFTQGSAAWTECNNRVGAAFSNQKSPPAVALLPDLLEQVPILMFNGDQDYICNHVGNEKLIKDLTWNGQTGFDGINETAQDWYFKDNVGGTVTTGRNLTYVRVNNGSHMLPWDQPEQTRFIFNVFAGLSDWDSAGTIVHTHPDVSDDADKPDTDKLVSDAKWSAYYRAGGVALVIVLLAASGLGIFIWRSRAKRNDRFYSAGHLPDASTSGLLKSFVSGLTRWKKPHRERGDYVDLSDLRGPYRQNIPDIVIQDDESDTEVGSDGPSPSPPV